MLRLQGFSATLNKTWGLDHGASMPLNHIDPEHDIPVLQLSLTRSEDRLFYERMDACLRPLGDQGILIVGSGSASHKLHAYFTAHPETPTPKWVETLIQWLTQSTENQDRQALLSDSNVAPCAAHNHPTQEQLLPLLVAMAAAAHLSSPPCG